MYIPGKKLGGTDALSRYGVRHGCETEEISLRKHLIGLLASEVTDMVLHLVGSGGISNTLFITCDMGGG